MAVAVFGLTACIPGIVSWGVAELACKRRYEQCNKIVETFNKKMQVLLKQWKEQIGEGVKPDSIKNIYDLIPSCPHKEESQADDCSVDDCKRLRREMHVERVLLYGGIQKQGTVSKNRLLSISIITAVAMTILTASFILPLCCPLLIGTHLALSVGAAFIGTDYVLSKRGVASTIGLKPSTQS